MASQLKLVFKPSPNVTAKGATAKLQGPGAGKAVVQYKPPKSIPAGTPPRRPGPDPYAALAAGQLDTRATALANANLLPQQQEIRRQQEAARAQAAADEGAIRGFSGAAAEYLKGIPEQVGAGYQAAAGTVGALGAGIGGAVGEDLAAKQAADQAAAEAQGQTGGKTFEGKGVGDTVAYLGGVIPGESMAHQGAAAQAEAARAVQIPLDAGAEQLTARMAQARSENDQYAQQLISLAATFPGLKAQALQQLNAYEIDKANYREQVSQDKIGNKRQAAQDVETRRVDTANITHMRRADALDVRAEAAQEQAAGIKATADAADLKYKYTYLGLQFRAKEDAIAAKNAANGRIIDTAASKLLGHVVYKDGTENPSIKVKQTTASTPQQKAKLGRAKAVSKARVSGFDYATKLRGKPVAVDKATIAAARAIGKLVGQYVADPKYAAIKQGRPGAVYPSAYPGAPATTNKPSRAAHVAGTGGAFASDYTDAQAKVWAEIDGDGLMSRYGYSREAVLAIVNAALARAGWRK